MNNFAQNDFEENKSWSIGIEETFVHPFIEAVSFKGRFVPCNKGRYASQIMQRDAVDFVRQLPDNEEAAGTECKIDNHYHRSPRNLFFETESCTSIGLESPGWGRYGECDELLYCFVAAEGPLKVTMLHAYLMDFQRLKQWIFSTPELLVPSQYRKMGARNKSGGYLIPFRRIVESVPTQEFLIWEKGRYKRIGSLIRGGFA